MQLWEGLPDFHTSDIHILFDIRQLCLSIFGHDPHFPSLSQFRPVDSAELFGAARHSSLYDALPAPLPIPAHTATALATAAKARAFSVKKLVNARLRDLPPEKESALHALHKVWFSQQPPTVSISVQCTDDIKRAMETVTNPFGKHSAARSSALSAESASDGPAAASDGTLSAMELDLGESKDEDTELSQVLALSSIEFEQHQREVHRHETAVEELGANLGYTVKRVEANGHCGPAVVIDQLNIRPKLDPPILHATSLSTVGDVRAELASELLGAHRAEYLDLAGYVWSGKQFAEEVDAWMKSGSWKSEIMNMFPLAVANRFQATVLLVRSIAPNILVVLPTHAPARRVFAFAHLLVANKEHYNSLRPADFATEQSFIKLLGDSVCL